MRGTSRIPEGSLLYPSDKSGCPPHESPMNVGDLAISFFRKHLVYEKGTKCQIY